MVDQSNSTNDQRDSIFPVDHSTPHALYYLFPLIYIIILLIWLHTKELTSYKNKISHMLGKINYWFAFYSSSSRITLTCSEPDTRNPPRMIGTSFSQRLRNPANSQLAWRDRFPYTTVIAFANANSAGDCECRRGNPMQLLQGFEKDLCHYARTLCMSVATHVAETCNARNKICARPSTGMWHGLDRTLAIDRVASRVSDKRALLIRVNNHR